MVQGPWSRADALTTVKVLLFKDPAILSQVMETKMANGLKLLDAHFGPDWWKKVDWEKLDFSGETDGVSHDLLTQLFGDTIAGLETLGISGQACEHGFAPPTLTAYRELKQAWREALRERALTSLPKKEVCRA